MKRLYLVFLLTLCGGCAAPDRSPDASTGNPEPAIAISWDVRTGDYTRFIRYAAPESYVGSTLRVLIKVNAKEASGRRVTYAFMPEETVLITNRQGIVDFPMDHYLFASKVELGVGSYAGTGTFWVALHETSDPAGGAAKYGHSSVVTVAKHAVLLSTKAISIYKDQVSNAIESEQEVYNMSPSALLKSGSESTRAKDTGTESRAHAAAASRPAAAQARDKEAEPATPSAESRLGSVKELEGALIRTLYPCEQRLWVTELSCPGEGAWIVAVDSIRRKAALYDRASGRGLDLAAALGPGECGRLSVSPDGRHCAARVHPEKGPAAVKVLRLPALTLVRELPGADFASGDFWWMPSGEELLLEHGSDISRWSVKTGARLSGCARLGSVKAIAPDGRHVACAMGEPLGGAAHAAGYRIQIIPVEDPSKAVVFVAHTEWIGPLAFSPDGTILASAGADNLIKLWSVPDGRPVRTLAGHEGTVKGLDFTPDGKTLVSGSADKTVRWWDLAAGAPSGILTLSTPVACLDLSSDGKTLALGDERGRVSICNHPQLRSMAAGKPR